jgi:hypothetical protein
LASLAVKVVNFDERYFVYKKPYSTNISMIDLAPSSSTIQNYNWWYTVITVVGTILSLLVPITAILAFHYNNQAQKSKDAELARFQATAQADIANANARAEEANVEIAKSNERVAEARAEAAKANARAEEANAQIVKSNERIEEAKANAAQANARAEEANVSALESIVRQKQLEQENIKLALQLEGEKRQRQMLEADLAPRMIAIGGDDTSLQAFAGTKVLVESLAEDEALNTAEQIVSLLQWAGWNVSTNLASTPIPNGVVIEYYQPDEPLQAAPLIDAAMALKAKLESNNIKIPFFLRKYNIPPDIVKVRVGKKPIDYFLNKRAIEYYEERIKQLDLEIDKTQDEKQREILRKAKNAAIQMMNFIKKKNGEN